MDDDEARLSDESSPENGENGEETHKCIEERVKIFKNMSEYEKKLIKGFMRSFGNTMILWLISKKRQHGYEIMTKLHESSPYDDKMPSASKIYPVLHDLEKNELIKGSWEHQGKRKVKYYEITDEGKQVLSRFRKLAHEARKNHSSLWLEFIESMISDEDNTEL
jgi:DNA-binding PadR family transcriptional regulator